jgi:Domain of unknown function (DUF5625)
MNPWTGHGLTNAIGKYHNARSVPVRSNAAIIPVVCVWLLLLWQQANAATGLPFAKPLRFGVDQSVEFSVELARHRYYFLDVVFYFQNTEQRAVAKEIVGEPTPVCKALNDCGVTPSFLVTIKSADKIILTEEKTPGGHYAFQSNQFNRHILITPLRPGTYTITVQVTQSADGLISIPAGIELSTDARTLDIGN